MASVVYSARSLDHIERAFRFLREDNPAAALAAVAAIQSAANHLAAHPLVGRRIEGELRELVVSYGQTGYVALFRFVVSRTKSVIRQACRSGARPARPDLCAIGAELGFLA